MVAEVTSDEGILVVVPANESDRQLRGAKSIARVVEILIPKVDLERSIYNEVDMPLVDHCALDEESGLYVPRGNGWLHAVIPLKLENSDDIPISGFMEFVPSEKSLTL